MFADDHDALPEREAFVRPVRDGRVESRMPNGDRTCCGDDPANMVRLLIPQLDAEAHVRNVVQVRIGELAKCAVDLAVQIGRCVPMQAALLAQLFQQAKRVELAILFYRVRTAMLHFPYLFFGGMLVARRPFDSLRLRRIRDADHEIYAHL